VPIRTTEGDIGRPEGVLSIPEVLGANVRAYRLLRRKEQQDVAEGMQSLGHTWRRATVSEVERAQRNVTVSELLALVVVLDASVEQLLDSRGPEGRTGPGMALAIRTVRITEDSDGRVRTEVTQIRGPWKVIEPQQVTELTRPHSGGATS
jgi:transcriptional regulator with XRE-family HTH domain